MFLEDSSIGRELWREACPSLIDKVAELFPVILEQEGLRNGPLCYQAVKVNTEYGLYQPLTSWLLSTKLYLSFFIFHSFIRSTVQTTSCHWTDLWVGCVSRCLTDLGPVPSGVFAGVSAVARWGGPSGLGEGTGEFGSAEHPTVSNGHHPGTGLCLTSIQVKSQTILNEYDSGLPVCSPWCRSMVQRLLLLHGPL